jgi:hypothetical protein
VSSPVILSLRKKVYVINISTSNLLRTTLDSCLVTFEKVESVAEANFHCLRSLFDSISSLFEY